MVTCDKDTSQTGTGALENRCPFWYNTLIYIRTSMPFFPDCYDEWGLYKITYDGDHKSFEMLFEGTEEECRQYAYENYTDKEQGEMCQIS